QVRGDIIGVASDIYSLGVLLYKLLTGHLPYKFKSYLPHEIVNTICEQEMEKPVLKDLHLADDLENILRKVLSKEPERRYASVEQFSQDIERALENLPVSARPDTIIYRSGKFLRRNRNTVAVAVLILVLLIGGLVAALWQARIADKERAKAQQQFNDVRRLANSYIF